MMMGIAEDSKGETRTKKRNQGLRVNLEFSTSLYPRVLYVVLCVILAERDVGS